MPCPCSRCACVLPGLPCPCPPALATLARPRLAGCANNNNNTLLALFVRLLTTGRSTSSLAKQSATALTQTCCWGSGTAATSTSGSGQPVQAGTTGGWRRIFTTAGRRCCDSLTRCVPAHCTALHCTAACLRGCAGVLFLLLSPLSSSLR